MFVDDLAGATLPEFFVSGARLRAGRAKGGWALSGCRRRESGPWQNAANLIRCNGGNFIRKTDPENAAETRAGETRTGWERRF